MEDCRNLFNRMREAHDSEDTAYDNGAEAMAETLEVIRKNEVHINSFVDLCVSLAINSTPQRYKCSFRCWKTPGTGI